MPGGTYSYMSVKDEDQMKEAKACGWFESLGEAEKGESKGPELVEETVAEDDESAPTRAELEQMAKESGIPFNTRTSDETLLDRINSRVDV